MTVKLRSITNIAGIAIVLIAALVLSACGGDEEPAVSDTADSSGVASQPITSDTSAGDDAVPADADPTTTSKQDPPEVAVTPLEAPESCSMEEQILAVFERQVRAMNTQDYEAFVDTCAPGNWTNDQATWDKLAFWWDQGGDLGKVLPEFTYESFNARGVEFRSYPKDTASTKFNVYNYDTLLVEGYSWWWEKVDGEWYSTSRTCTGATGRQT